MSNRNTQDDISVLILRYLAGEATEGELAELKEATDHDTGLAECLFQNACQEVELHDYFQKIWSRLT